jgi:hypothetical protein
MLARGVPVAGGDVVSFAFYTGLKSGEPLVNRATQWWTGSRYIHCEVVFHTPNGGHLACGVWQGENVFLRRKSFYKSAWEWRSVRLTAAKVARMKAFCRRQADARRPFNRWGLVRCRTPFPRPTDGTAWFCSELCTAALQEVGLLQGEEPGAVCPGYFHELLGRLDSFHAMSAVADERIQRTRLTCPLGKKSLAVIHENASPPAATPATPPPSVGGRGLTFSRYIPR